LAAHTDLLAAESGFARLSRNRSPVADRRKIIMAAAGGRIFRR